VKGKLVHVNNRKWEPKISTLEKWDKQWRAFNPPANGQAYYGILTIFGKPIAK
jgi:hypothetical protein